MAPTPLNILAPRIIGANLSSDATRNAQNASGKAIGIGVGLFLVMVFALGAFMSLRRRQRRKCEERRNAREGGAEVVR